MLEGPLRWLQFRALAEHHSSQEHLARAHRVEFSQASPWASARVDEDQEGRLLWLVPNSDSANTLEANLHALQSFPPAEWPLSSIPAPEPAACGTW